MIFKRINLLAFDKNSSIFSVQLEALFVFSVLLIAFTSIFILAVNTNSISAYFYFLFFWITFIIIFDYGQLPDFLFAFLCNGFFTSLFILIQSYVYPNSYGTTSELSPTWTDDSYFFTLIADEIPYGMFTRDYYYLYDAFFSNLIKYSIPFKVTHPLDAIYFQSGIAAVLSTYTKLYAYYLSEDKTVSKTGYLFCVVSPFLLMNGGALFLRDTLVAALFMLSLVSINRKNWLIVILIFILQIYVRAGTAFILLLSYPFLYYTSIKNFLINRKNIWVVLTLLFSIIVSVTFALRVFADELNTYLLEKGVSTSGREMLGDFLTGSEDSVIFFFIQSQPLIIRAVFSSLYIFTYPFFNFSRLTSVHGIDARSLLINFIYPLYSIFLNGWFFSVFCGNIKAIKDIKAIKIAFVVTCVLIGLFSLQTRHKTIITPLYYVITAIGCHSSSRQAKYIGFGISSIWFFCQFLLAFSRFK
jgi:hypothetical protein